jgi:hypothetical protein
LRRERAGKRPDLDAHIVFPKNRLFPRIELLSLVDVLSARVAPHRERSHQTDDLLLVLVLELSTGDLGRVEVWSSQEPKRERERGQRAKLSLEAEDFRRKPTRREVLVEDLDRSKHVSQRGRSRGRTRDGDGPFARTSWARCVEVARVRRKGA